MGLIQRLQNQKASLSLVLNIAHGFVSNMSAILMFAYIFMSRRQIMAEATDTVD